MNSPENPPPLNRGPLSSHSALPTSLLGKRTVCFLIAVLATLALVAVAFSRPSFEPVFGFELGASDATGKLLYYGDGNFYGPGAGGPLGYGVIYRVAADGKISTVVAFTGTDGPVKGRGPGELVRDEAGLLWGVTNAGGTENRGTVFKLDPKSGVLTTIAEFTSGNVASRPYGPLVADGNGFFWG